jgi:hypothetical protein
MGSAEYEFGAMPNSLRQMAKNACADNSRLVPRELSILDRDGRPLLVIGIKEGQVEEYQEAIKPVVYERAQTKGHTGFDDIVTPYSQLSSYHILKCSPPAGFKRGEKKEEWLKQQRESLTRFWGDLSRMS